jgi:NitT/TauT family transport system substrate-binding protein
MRLILGSVIAIAIVFGFLSARAAESEISVTVGTANSVSDAPLYIADKKGFFKEAGLLVTTTQFNSAPNMVAPLGAGQLDVGAGSASAALYNAVARGLKIKIVADKASSPPGYGATKLLVRKDLIESGRFKSLVSLKGMTIAMNAPGVSNTSTLNSALHSVGLSYSDVSTVNLSFPDHLIALLNKSVDAGVTTKPTATAAVKSGAAVEIKRDDEIDPGHQIAVLLFSEYFSAKREAAVRFMRTY